MVTAWQPIQGIPVKAFFLIANLKVPWCHLRPFCPLLSFVAWEKDRLLPHYNLLSGSHSAISFPQTFSPGKTAQFPQTLPQICCFSLDTLFRYLPVVFTWYLHLFDNINVYWIFGFKQLFIFLFIYYLFYLNNINFSLCGSLECYNLHLRNSVHLEFVLVCRNWPIRKLMCFCSSLISFLFLLWQ